jgi:predicted deacylase
MERGIPSITVEIRDPQRFQSDSVRRALAGVRAVLTMAGMRRGKPSQKTGPDPMLCEGSRWLYTDHGGLLRVFPENADIVEEGELVARLMNVFGDVVREYKAPYRGVVIGKSVNPVSQTGSRILHLGRLAGPDRGFIPPPENWK